MYRNSVFPRNTLSTSAIFPVNCSPSCFKMQKHNTYDTSDQYLLGRLSVPVFLNSFPRNHACRSFCTGDRQSLRWKKPLSLSEIIIPMKFLSRILPICMHQPELPLYPVSEISPYLTAGLSFFLPDHACARAFIVYGSLHRNGRFFLWLPECQKFYQSLPPEAGHDAKRLSEKVPP